MGPLVWVSPIPGWLFGCFYSLALWRVGSAPGAGYWVVSMLPAHGRLFCSRGPFVLYRDLTGLAATLSAPSYWHTSEGTDLRKMAPVRQRLPSEMRKSQCLRSHDIGRQQVGGQCPWRHYWPCPLIEHHYGWWFIFSGLSALWKRLFEESFGWGEILSVDSALDEKHHFVVDKNWLIVDRTPPQVIWDALQMVPFWAYTGKDTLQIRSTGMVSA